MILYEVLTTEKVPFYYRVAGVGSRFLAWLIDMALLAVMLVAGTVFATALEIGRAGVGMAVALLWRFALIWGYFLLFEWLLHGQTPGKRVLGIRVISREGTGISFLQSAVRNVLRMADGLPFPFLAYGLGGAVAACNREGRRLGDLAAGTLVVHVEARSQPVLARQDQDGEAPRLREAQVRQRLQQLDRQQKHALIDLCLRREQLRLADRTRLFRAVTDYFRERLDLAPEEYQSDEKFVLQLAAVLSEQSSGEPGPAAAGRRPARRGLRGR